jgi:hypothetical protein
LKIGAWLAEVGFRLTSGWEMDRQACATPGMLHPQSSLPRKLPPNNRREGCLVIRLNGVPRVA